MTDHKPLAGVSCLVVEDEGLIALDLETMILAAGAASVDLASTLAEAETALSRAPRLAILDYFIGKTTTVELAKACVRTGCAVVFVTGYDRPADLPEELAGAPFVSKPFVEAMLHAAAAEALAGSPDTTEPA